MKKFSKEAKIGLLVACSILIFFTGFYFLKGSDVFSGEYHYYGWYESVQGLTPSAAVQIKGVNVGKVVGIKLYKDKVKITFSISKKTRFPKNTIARMISLDLLGTKAIRLEPGDSKTLAEDEDVIPTDVESGIIDNLSQEISPLITDVRSVISVLDSVLVGVDSMLNPQTRQNLTSSVSSLNVTMQNLSEMSQRINRESGELASAIHNMNSITDNLAKNNESIGKIIDNAASVTTQLKNSPIDQTIRELQGTASQMNILLDKINKGEGSVGMAVNDKQLYTNLSQTLTTLQSLIADIQAHPTRYINVTIFGHKKK